jgi:hypothetical protein
MRGRLLAVAQSPKPSAGPLVAGIVTGLVAGSTVFFLVVFLVSVAILSSLHQDRQVPVLVACYVIAVALGAWGLVLGRARSNFLVGLLIGGAIGMLGGTALCNVLLAGMSNGAMR